MSTERDMSDASSLSSEESSDDIHNFEEEEMVNVSSLKDELMAEFKRSVKAELDELREEVNKLRAERDRAVCEVQELRELLNARENAAVNVSNARTPPRKVAKPWTESTATSADFPALPSRPAAESGPSAKPQRSAQTATMPFLSRATAAASTAASTAASNAASTAASTAASNASTRTANHAASKAAYNAASTAASTSKGYAASASTSTGANSNKNTAANGKNDASKFKKTLQAIDTDVFKVRRVLSSSSVANFTIKQASKRGPVKIVITDAKDILPAKAALGAEKISYHEFKNPDERMKCFIIRGLVGATETDLPFIKEELCLLGLPSSITVSLHTTGFMKANPDKDQSAPVKLVLPPNFDEKSLVCIKHLNHMAIRFEAFKSKTIMQCKNCQRFGHSASGCQHEHRCVKCGANHYRDACPRTSNSSVKLVCCNCGGEHTANNLLNCPFFMERYGNKKDPVVPVTAVSKQGFSIQPRQAPANIQPGVSYARAASSNIRSASNVQQLPAVNINTNTNDSVSVITDQLSKILTKMEEHSKMWMKHDRLLKYIMDHMFNCQDE